VLSRQTAEAKETVSGYRPAPPDEVGGRRAPGPVPSRYAIAQGGDRGLRLLRVALGCNEEALVVFSSLEAAQSFPLFNGLRGGGWYVRGCSAGELISLLLGPYVDIDWVLLDPLPGRFAPVDTPTNLAQWEDFVDDLLG
jgi:hypothetical protein